ncbi:uncharacterized protein B4U80_07646, partial [Leptotrombidium deliense]
GDGEFKPCSSRNRNTSKIFVHPELFKYSHVFLRVDTLVSSLEKPYRGPHKVIARTDKTLTRNGKETMISIDRVKPALNLDDVDSTTSHQAQHSITQSGRRVHFPDFHSLITFNSLAGGGVMYCLS